MQPIFLRELAENDWVDFNGFHILAAHQETHILKPLERIGKNIFLHIFPGVSTLLIDAVRLFCYHPMRFTIFIEVDKIIHNIRQSYPTVAVHILVDCLEQHRLIGIAHIHCFDELHKLVCHILRRN